MTIYIRKIAVNGKKNTTRSTANIPRPRRMRFLIVISGLQKLNKTYSSVEKNALIDDFNNIVLLPI